jgi:hypothetical protein
VPDPVSSPTPARRTSWWFRLLRGVLNLALLGLLGLQIFAVVALGTDYHLRLPGFARHALEARLQDQGLTISFSGMDVSLAGSLLLHEPKVFLAGGAEPVAEADLLYADPDWLALLVGHRLSFREVRLINANFYCPPESSPTGLREPFITRLDTALMGQGASWWRLDHLQARFLNALIFAQGTFLLPPLATAPSPSATLAALYRQWSRKLVDLGPQFARVDNQNPPGGAGRTRAAAGAGTGIWPRDAPPRRHVGRAGPARQHSGLRVDKIGELCSRCGDRTEARGFFRARCFRAHRACEWAGGRFHRRAAALHGQRGLRQN